MNRQGLEAEPRDTYWPWQGLSILGKEQNRPILQSLQLGGRDAISSKESPSCLGSPVLGLIGQLVGLSCSHDARLGWGYSHTQSHVPTSTFPCSSLPPHSFLGPPHQVLKARQNLSRTPLLPEPERRGTG